MMEFAETPIVLAAEWHGRDLVVRIDSNLWQIDVRNPSAVRVLTIHSARLEDGEDLLGWSGHHIDVDEYEESGARILEVYINYPLDPIEIACASTSEQLVPYTDQDVAAKFAAVVAVARTYAEESEQLSRELNRIRAEVGSKIDHELDVGERKRQFFAVSHPERAQAIHGHLKFLQAVREKLAR